MLSKKDRTLDEYKRAGAEMRLLKELGSRLTVDISKVLSAQDTDILTRALSKIDEVCSRAEDNMFCDHPDLPNTYINVFYGNVSGEPINDVDSEITHLAKEVADELFG